MNQSSDVPPPAPAPPTGFFASVRRIRIWRTDDRWIGGVAAGISHRMGIDPVILRGLFVVTALFGGVGLVFYGLAWALLPEASDNRIHLEEAVRGSFDVALAGAGAFFVLGVGNPFFWWDGSGGWSLSWLLVVGAIVGIVALVHNQRRSPVPPPYTPPPETTMPLTDGTAHPGATDHPGAAAAPATPPSASTTATLDAPTAALPPLPDRSDAPADPSGTSAPADDSATATGDATSAYNVGGPTPETRASAPGSLEDPGAQWSGAGSGGYGPGGYGTGGYGTGYGGTGGWDGGGGPPPHGPATPPEPPRAAPVVPGPGSRLTSAVLALCLLGVAGIALADHNGVLAGNAWLLAGGGVLTILGLGVLLSGVLGRRQGGLGALAILTAVVVVPSAAVVASVPGLTRIGEDGWRVVGEQEFTPTTLAAADAGRSLGAGSLIVDLTELDIDEDVTIPLELGFGSTHVIVPDDVGVTINAEVGAGEVVGPLDEDWDVRVRDTAVAGTGDSRDTISGGVGVDVRLTRPGDPHVTVNTDVGFGQIIIEEQP